MIGTSQEVLSTSIRRRDDFMARFRTGLAFAVFALGVGAAPWSTEAVNDHLNCYKIKTTTPSASYTADLADLVAQPGCVIKVPAKLLCVETSKMNVIPTPPGSVVGGPAGRFLCYKAKCPNTAGPITVDDQFRSHTVTPSATKMVCAPAPTTTTLPSCGLVGEPCCAGVNCAAGQGACIGGTCELCGAAGEPCCAGNSRDMGMACTMGACTPCGDPG